MKTTRTAVLLGLLTAAFAPAAVVYDNSGNDLAQSFFWSSGWDELGDQVMLVGTDRQITSAQLQLFNLGVAGTFDATLRFYNEGSPVGAGLGEFTLTNLAAPDLATAGGVFTLLFSTSGLLAPDEVIFTLAVFNQSAGVDLGLNLLNPLVQGSSAAGFSIRRAGSSFSQEVGADLNYYLVLDAGSGAGTAVVPEPTPLVLTLWGVVLMVARKRPRFR